MAEDTEKRLLHAWKMQDLYSFKHILTNAGFAFKSKMPLLSIIAKDEKHDGKRFAEALLATLPELMDIQDDDGNFPIHLAAAAGNLPVLEAIIEASADPNAMNWGGSTPLHVLAEKNWRERSLYRECFQFLLKTKDVNINFLNWDGFTPIHWALFCRNYDAVDCLLEQLPTLIDLDNEIFGKTARELLKEKYPKLKYRKKMSVQIMDGSQLFQYLKNDQEDRFCEEIIIQVNKYGSKNFLKFYNGECTFLQYACKHGKSKVVEVLLRNGADPNGTSPNNPSSPLKNALLYGRLEIIRILIKNHYFDLKKSLKGELPLHLIVKSQYETSNKISCLEMLLNKDWIDSGDININLQDEKGNTALHYAAHLDDEKLVATILKNGASCGLVNKRGNTAYHIAAQNRNQSVLGTLLKHSLVYMEIVNKDGDAPLHIAAQHGDEAIVADLLDNGARILLKNKIGDTPLHCAVRLDNNAAFNELLHRGADKEMKNGQGNTVLHTAVRYQNISAAVQLLTNGADQFATNDEGNTPLHLAVQIENEEIVKELLKFGDYEEIINKNGDTVLHIAVLTGNEAIVANLLQHGADIGKENNNGDIPVELITFRVLKDFLDSKIQNKKSGSGILENETIEFDLSLLVPKPSVQSGQYKKLPNISETGLKNEAKILLKMIQTRDLKPLLAHPVITTFTFMKWQRMKVFFFINFFFYITFCFLLTILIVFVEDTKGYISTVLPQNTSEQVKTKILPYNQLIISDPSTVYYLRVFILFLTFVLFIREIFQILNNYKSYFKNFENLLELLLVAFSVFLMVSNCGQQISSDSFSGWICPQISAAAILIAWFDFVLLIGKHPSISVEIEMFRRVAKTFLKLLSRFIILIMAFALSFYVLFRGCRGECKENPFQNIGFSVFKTLVMVTGEFEAGEIPFEINILTSFIIFIFFIFLITIVLMSLLNGLAVADTKEIQRDAYIYSALARVQFISVVELMLFPDIGCLNKVSKIFQRFTCYRIFLNYLKKKRMYFSLLKKDGIIQIIFEETKNVKIVCGDEVGSFPIESFIISDTLVSAREIIEKKEEGIGLREKVDMCCGQVISLGERLLVFEKRFEDLSKNMEKKQNLIIIEDVGLKVKENCDELNKLSEKFTLFETLLLKAIEKN